MHKKTQQVLKHHHKKPYRIHHITLAGFAIFILFISLVYIGVFYLLQPLPPPVSGEQSSRQARADEHIEIRSSHGFSMNVDLATYMLEATVDGADSISNPTELETGEQPIDHIQLKPKSGTVDTHARASTLSITHENTSQETEATAALENDSYERIDTTEETIAGELFEKHTYEYTPQYESNNKQAIYSIVWLHENEGSRYVILLQGLISDATIPSTYASTLDSIRFGETLGVQFFSRDSSNWVSRSDSTRQYLSDLLSPAVVKLYHVACGSVQFDLQDIPEQQCRAATGSGFFISSEGHIATNGHVVVYEPEDALVDTLLSNPLQLSTFLTEVVGMSTEDIATLEQKPEELAWVVSQIYDLPGEKISFDQKHEVILAATGSTPLLPESEEEIEELFTFRDTTDIKRAEIVDYDFSGKDQLNIASGNVEGFSQSDVALLRVRAEHTPLIQLAAPVDASPGQSITILGFPSDAENELVDHTELVTSVTNGTISSIRTAAGGSGALIQTDADASQGNSGGPAVTNSGKAVGLLTYRYKDETTQNAAKSYLRDINDLRRLIERKNLSLNVNSPTQQAWSSGLELYASNRYSDALEQFEQVAELYPAHRLVDTYIAASEINIADGLDRSTPTLQYAGIIGGTGMLAVSSRLISRHKSHHHAYKQQQESSASPDPQLLHNETEQTNTAA